MPLQTTPLPDLHLQTAILEGSGSQSRFAVVGSGTGAPVAWSDWTEQFSGVVSSAALGADPFSDRLLDVAAGDLVTFVIAVENRGAAPAWNLKLREALPPGFVPAAGTDIVVLDGAGNPLPATGNLFDPYGGLQISSGAALPGYDASSGLNVALVVFTAQATSAMPAPGASLASKASVVHVAASAGGADLSGNGAPGLIGTTGLTSAQPAVAVALTGTTDPATPGPLLRIGEGATFHATITLPSGQSRGVRVAPVLPAGMVETAATITYVTPGTTGLWVGERSTAGFDLGTLSLGQPVRVELDISAKVTGGTGGQVQAAVSALDPAGGTARVSIAAGTAVVVNPPPTIAGCVAGQSATTTGAALPFAGVVLADAAGLPLTLTVRLFPGAGTLNGTGGVFDAASGTYTAHGTAAALQADLRALLFQPTAAGTSTLAVTLDDGTGGTAADGTTTVAVQPSADTAGVAQHFARLPGATFLTNAGGVQTVLAGEEYHGPVDSLHAQLILDSPGPAAIAAQVPDAFIKSFSGFCAIQLQGGRNVVDAGPGSNFITGGPGNDTFFLVGSPDAPVWDTVVGFHPGDAVTLWGFHPGTSTYAWADGDGAAGYAGRTLHADLAGTGQTAASVTFAGLTAADAAGWVVSTGTVGGVDYLAVVAVS